MNRLILIGNGFDLAHGMKTRYSDFVFHYIKDAFRIAENENAYEDELLLIVKNHGLFRKSFEGYENIEDYLNFRFSKIATLQDHFSYSNSAQYAEHFKDFFLKIKSPFFEYLITHCSKCGWVDIESEYYAELIKILDLKEEVDYRLSELNMTLKAIIKALESYLTILPLPKINNAYRNLFTGKIEKEDIVTVKFEEDVTPTNTMILNFNYTKAVQSYLSPLYMGDYLNFMHINYIHGELLDRKNPIIFGFGDEIDDDYKKLESEKRKGFLEHIKSFWYFKTKNYHHLMRFIGSEDFQVYVMGHSCGLSDRTMLKMIFEHDNCKSIKIYYHQRNKWNNFSELTQEIARHFQDKGIMRMKIVPFELSQPLPQS